MIYLIVMSVCTILICATFLVEIWHEKKEREADERWLERLERIERRRERERRRR